MIPLYNQKLSQLVNNSSDPFAFFSDSAGAKVILSFLALHYRHSRSTHIFSDRSFSFYSDFPFDVFVIEEFNYISSLLNVADILFLGTSYSTGFELELIALARSLNIPSISIVDYPSNFKLRFTSSSNQLILPDFIVVSSGLAKQMAIDEGIPEPLIYIEKNPYLIYLDLFLKSKYKPPSSISKPSTILYLPEPISTYGLSDIYGFDEIDGLNCLLDSLSSFDSTHLNIIVKPHPNHHPSFCSDVMSLNSHSLVNIACNKDANLFELFSNSAVVVGFYSNVILEADSFGVACIRPLFLANDTKIDPIALELSDRVINVRSRSDLDLEFLRLFK